jgi:2-C-methyl-D-erythritol 2,4-cyclodiphosphate synthase
MTWHWLNIIWEEVEVSFRVGLGFDTHQFQQGKPLIIGGVRVSYPFGLKGHSDADVLVHSIIDALLGAACLGDIGTYFPDSDPTYEGVSSLELLKKINSLLKQNEFSIINIDVSIVLEDPKLAPFFPQMKKNIARTLDINETVISLKAKTSEGMGYIGKGEGVACYAVAFIESKKER